MSTLQAHASPQTRHPGPADAAVCRCQRLQPYRFIHKGLRVLLMQALQQAGASDVRHADERAALVDTLERALTVCADHLAHENRFFHQPLRQRAPGAAAPFDRDHADHLQAIDALRQLLQRVRDADTGAAALAYELYLGFSRFVADNLLHMAEEETTLTQALWAHFTDAEIQALEDELRAALSPDEQAQALLWMARGLDGAELEALLMQARGAVPPAAFEALHGLVAAQLVPARQARLARALGRPPVPGLVAA